MTETRKQIIELISEYMDKTLSEGCLIKWQDTNYLKFEFLWLWYQWTFINWDTWGFLDKTKCKILWHYDITAVLKYLNEKGCVHMVQHHKNTEFAEPWDELKLFYIPTKPLHLYTEQEDKELLELLLKLIKHV